MILRYTNIEGETITVEQLSTLKEYKVFQEENTVVKRIDSINKSSEKYPIHVCYFISENERFNEIVESLSFETNSFDIVEISAYLTYEIHIHKCYIDHEYGGIIKKLFKNGLEICWQQYNYLTEEPLLDTTTKEFYDSEGRLLLRFDYDAKGNVNTVDGNRFFAPFDEHISWTSATTFIEYNPDFFDENPYYANANFLP